MPSLDLTFLSVSLKSFIFLSHLSPDSTCFSHLPVNTGLLTATETKEEFEYLTFQHLLMIVTVTYRTSEVSTALLVRRQFPPTVSLRRWEFLSELFMPPKWTGDLMCH